MRKRTFRIGVVVCLALVLVLGLASLAGASPWSDLPDGVLDSYGVTSDQVAGISSGYPDGSFKPYQNINRAQFVKMATAAFTIPSASPATPTFTDVPATHFYYQHIEGAYAAGLTNGIGAGRFGPEQTVTREQAIAMIVRQVAAEQGFALASLTEAQISAALAGFADAASVSAGLRDEMAYALMNDITKGNAAGSLAPKTPVSRLTAAVLLVRAGQAEPPAGDAPVITALSPADGKVAGGTTVTITGVNLSGATAVTFGGTVATDFTVVSDTTITAVAPAAVLAAGKAHKTVNVSVATAEGTNADTLADDYIYYTLTLKKGSNIQTYSLSDLRARTPVSGYWGPHKDGGTNNHYTGVPLLDLLADVGGLPAGHGLTVKTADNFDCNYDAPRLAQMADGSYQMWEHNNTASMSDDIETTGSVQMVLAYEMNGGSLEESTAPGRDIGPVRIVLLRPAADVLTEGKYSPYLVVAVEVLE